MQTLCVCIDQPQSQIQIQCFIDTSDAQLLNCQMLKFKIDDCQPHIALNETPIVNHIFPNVDFVVVVVVVVVSFGRSTVWCLTRQQCWESRMCGSSLVTKRSKTGSSLVKLSTCYTCVCHALSPYYAVKLGFSRSRVVEFDGFTATDPGP